MTLGYVKKKRTEILPPCNTATLTFSWNCLDLPVGVTYTVKANFTCTCGGSDGFVYGNITKRHWGDVNGDGDVDSFDVGKLDLIYSKILTEKDC